MRKHKGVAVLKVPKKQRSCCICTYKKDWYCAGRSSKHAQECKRFVCEVKDENT